MVIIFFIFKNLFIINNMAVTAWVRDNTHARSCVDTHEVIIGTPEYILYCQSSCMFAHLNLSINVTRINNFL